MTTQTLAIERTLWDQCRHCGGLMVPEHLDDSVLDADTCKETAWHCLTCNTSVTLEDTALPRGGPKRERPHVTRHFSTFNYTRRVA
jgi:hypothetical protein